MPLICLENQANQVKIKIVFMKRIIVLASLFLVIGFNASAEGYQVNLQSSKQAGMGHAGAALKLGAESMHFNPAGLSFMKENISKAVDAVSPTIGIHGKALVNQVAQEPEVKKTLGRHR